MKLLSVLVLYTTAVASFWLQAVSHEVHHLVRRSDVNVIETALYNISNYTAALYTQVEHFDISQITELQTGTNNALDAIAAGNKAVSAIQPIATSDVLLLTPIVANLAKLVNESITATIDHKEAFGGLAPVVLSGLQKQQNATFTFSTTVAQKLPSDLVGAAAAANQPIFNALASGIAVFQQPNVNKDPSLFTSGASSSAPTCWHVLFAPVLAVLVTGLVVI